MGLDVYLRKVDDYEKMRRLNAEGEEQETAIWKEYGEYGDLDDAQKEQARAQIAAMRSNLGLTGDYGSYPEERVEIDSTAYPDHIFKVGYFRSSYNGSGINSFFRRIGLPDLYDLFGIKADEHDTITDWEAARPRVVDAIAKYKELMDAGIVDCFAVKGNMFKNKTDYPDSEHAALSVYKDGVSKGSPFDGWSTSNGEFHPGGIECIGFIPGYKYGDACTFVVYRIKREALEFYLHALEIVLETIDYVLAPDRDKFTYYLEWIG